MKTKVVKFTDQIIWGCGIVVKDKVVDTLNTLNFNILILGRHIEMVRSEKEMS